LPQQVENLRIFSFDGNEVDYADNKEGEDDPPNPLKRMAVSANEMSIECFSFSNQCLSHFKQDDDDDDEENWPLMESASSAEFQTPPNLRAQRRAALEQSKIKALDPALQKVS
jgi:hypothetical protein